MEGNSNTDKNFIAKDPFNNLSKSHLKIESKEVPIEKAHSYTNAKATKSNIPSQKVKSKVDTKADLRKLKEIKNK